MVTEENDIIIGGAAGYTWDQLKYWVNSIKKSGFKGKIVLVCTDISAETIKKLSDMGVTLSFYGTKQEDGSWQRHSNGAPHVERFFYIWAWLAQQSEWDVRFVFATDVRDVIFQTNPSNFGMLSVSREDVMLLAPEGMTYETEPWGKENFTQAFGPFFYKMVEKQPIYNVGVLAGNYTIMRDLMIMIFQMSLNRPIQIVDQAVYNFLMNIHAFEKFGDHMQNSDGWAIQLGTTIEAVKAGSGDIGVACKNNPNLLEEYKVSYFEDQPFITSDGIVQTSELGKPFVIVHQYDRIPSLKEKIEKIYG